MFSLLASSASAAAYSARANLRCSGTQSKISLLIVTFFPALLKILQAKNTLRES